MANRFPVTVDASGVPVLKELPSGDNLDLTGSGVVGAGTVALTNLTVGGSQGSDGQVLTSTGSGIAWENAASGGGGGGMFTQVGTATVSSEVFSIEFTSLSGYDEYELRFSGVYTGTTGAGLGLQFNYGSGYVINSSAYHFKARRFADANANSDGQYNSAWNYINLTYGSAASKSGDAYASSDGASYKRAGIIGRVTFSGSDSRVQAFTSHHAGLADTGLMDYQVTGQAKVGNVELAPTAVKIIAHRGSSSATSSSGQGIVAGKFTLYGRVAS